MYLTGELVKAVHKSAHFDGVDRRITSEHSRAAATRKCDESANDIFREYTRQ